MRVFVREHPTPKGKPVNIPVPGCGSLVGGNTNKLGDIGRKSGKELSFLVNSFAPSDPGIRLSGEWVRRLEEHVVIILEILDVSGAFLTIRENPREQMILHSWSYS